jgi:O-antigen/teichoic acid export membrane protein
LISQSESVVTLTAVDAPAPVRPQPSAQATVLSGSFIMLVAMMLVNVFNFAYNMVMARMLGPAAFGNINAAVTLLLLASCVSLAFQLVCAKFVARSQADSGKAAIVRNLLGKAWIVSLVLEPCFLWRRGPSLLS